MSQYSPKIDRDTANNVKHKSLKNDSFINEKHNFSTKTVIFENIKFSEMVDQRNINFHPKEFSNSSQGPLGPRDEILNSKGRKLIFL